MGKLAATGPGGRALSELASNRWPMAIASGMMKKHVKNSLFLKKYSPEILSQDSGLGHVRNLGFNPHNFWCALPIIYA